MNTPKNIHNLFQKILLQAKRLLGADGASIFLIDITNEHLILTATTGLVGQSKEELSKITYEKGQGLTGWIAQTGKAIIIKNMADVSPKISEFSWTGKYDEIEHQQSQIKSFLGVPILYENKVIGVLRVTKTIHHGQTDSVKSFSEKDLEILQIFAETAATAIETTQELELVTQAPYVFVLMPFSSDYSDIYELGIKDVTKSLEIRCERVDEIEFNDSILSQIYRGIQSADLIIADMTGKNPNVFYEVGYAHALHKEVVLLTQNGSDIPFDLKGHNHIIYEGSIMLLKKRLKNRLAAWKSNLKKNDDNINES